MSIINIIVFISLLHNVDLSNVFASVEDLKDVLEIENNMVGILKAYIAAEKRKIELLERYVENQKPKYEETKRDIEHYIGNPIYSFLLIKRLVIDWKHVEKSIEDADVPSAFFQNIFLYKQDVKFPTREDLTGVVNGIINLQTTYLINEFSIINGHIGGKQYNATLSGSDCYKIGEEAYASGNYYYAYTWLKQANAILKVQPDIHINRKDVLERLSIAAYRSGYRKLAVNYTKKLLKLDPTNERAAKNLASFGTVLESGIESIYHKKGLVELKLQSDRLCRKELKISAEITSNLKCHYVHNNNPFLFIAPFKLEEFYLNPKIVVFHDVISDEEIKIIKNLSLSKLSRAAVSHEYDESDHTYIRISKAAWLEDTVSIYVSKISQRISDMTGLNLALAEDLQVVNYGVGGYYHLHHDLALNEEIISENKLRIATVLIYMNNVEQGGATVFPLINVTIWPKQGTAAMWYNVDFYADITYHRAYSTMHAACPVLVGSKWVANKWIHAAGQEFIKSCPVHKQRLSQ